MLLSSRILALLLVFALTEATLLGAPDTILQPGIKAILSVSCDGSAPFDYLWRKDGSALPGATSSTYTIASFGLTDVGLYDVRVSNSAGSTVSDAIKLTLPVVGTPRITGQPVGQTLPIGGRLTLTVTATGGSSYQWKRNGVNVVGATSASYTITSVSSANAGNYTVVISSAGGSVTSAVAKVIVLAPPTDAQLKFTKQN